MQNESTPTAPAAEVVSVGPNYLGEALRSVSITLQHPFELNGAEIRQVTVRRIRGIEAKQHAQASLLAAEAGKIEPMFPGIQLSAEEYDALDDDDAFAIDEAVERFLPARFRALRALWGMQGSPDENNSLTGGQSPA
jgi:hypothetical protein